MSPCHKGNLEKWRQNSTHSSPWHPLDGNGQLHAPVDLPPGKELPLSNKQGDGMAPEPVWVMWSRRILLLHVGNQTMMPQLSIPQPSHNNDWAMFAPDSDKKHGKAFLPCSNCFGTKIKLQGLQLWYDMAQNLGAVIMRTTTEETKTYRIRNSWAQSQEFDNLMLCGYLHGLRNKRFLACPSRYSPIQLEQQTTQMTYRKLWREGRCKTREREREKQRQRTFIYIQ